MKGKKKYITIAVLCLTAMLGLIACLYAFGFRITYAPELENSWDAISAFAAWAGVIVSIMAVGVSGLAIYYAIQVPKKIADRQDKIALFEKRFLLFNELHRHITFASIISRRNNIEEDKLEFSIIFDYEPNNEVKQKEYGMRNELLLLQLPFLFPAINEKDCERLCNATSRYVAMGILCNHKYENAKNDYVWEVQCFSQKYWDMIRETMTIADSSK